MADSQHESNAKHRGSRAGRLRFAPIAIVAGVLASAALALSLNGTLAAFTASITNSSNSASSGTLIMTETQTIGATTTTCNSNDGNSNTGLNSATCATINKYGAATNLVPGGTSTATVTITNTGTAPASTFTLTPAACTQTGTVTGSATDLCTKMTVGLTKTISGTTTNVTPATSPTLAAFVGPYSIGTLAPNASVSFTFTVTLPAGLGNSYQGLTASQPMTWNFTAGS